MSPLIYLFIYFLLWIILKKSLLNLLQYCSCVMFWFSGCQASGILAPWPGMESASPYFGSWYLNHWTAREVPFCTLLMRKWGSVLCWTKSLSVKCYWKSWTNFLTNTISDSFLYSATKIPGSGRSTYNTCWCLNL